MPGGIKGKNLFLNPGHIRFPQIKLSQFSSESKKQNMTEMSITVEAIKSLREQDTMKKEQADLNRNETKL